MPKNRSLNIDHLTQGNITQESLKLVKSVSGVVTDVAASPLPGVNIAVKGTTIGTLTDTDGKYTIEVPDDKNVLTFSYVGYATQEIEVNSQTTINISLQEDIAQMNEVIVIGYGTQEEKDLTGSVASINSEAIENRQAIQVSDALQGAVAGVTVTRSGGAPGATSTIRVRGVTSLNVNDPLVIVDGIQGLSINDINPNDIESITVLKDAASQAVYGARASAGVILITTKRGSQGKLNISYDYELGLNSPTMMPDFVNAQTYMLLFNEQSTNDGGSPIFDQDIIDNYVELQAQDPDLNPDTDWQSVMLSESPATRHRHNLAFSAGSEFITTRASFSYVSEDAIYVNRDYERYTFRINNNLKFSKIIEANFDVYYKRTNTLQPSAGGTVSLARRYPGIYPAVRTDGEWGEGKDGTNPYAQLVDGGTK